MPEVQNIVKQQFAARLREDDQQIINEALPEIFPDHDLTTLTGREILRGSVEKAVRTVQKLSQSLPADLEKIQVLQADCDRLTAARDGSKQEVEQLESQVLALNELITELNDRNQNLGNRLAELQGTASNLEKYRPVDNEMRVIVPPFTLEVLKRYARKVAKVTGKETRPADLLVSLFNRYITAKEIELDGFPQLISKAEIKSIKDSLKQENEPAG
ncbi:MAG: hypothetical protein AB7U05_09035 [Mangrovibacterium sp.]